ncbi:RNA polymerase factor sigma-54 [Oceanobacillus saliphilus]|uniref:RNA polymerase factor sigma-54 n=1 Tax=Oceanobacillus saliphilus TaxID=2925834 RepID=UPI00201D852E|nr:RNA polymerase factor sigma-54 [Oceanobacillus saliphilus]
MKQKLVLKQSLQWKMNQSLMQSINILQLTSSELMDYIKEVANENPLIEEIDTDMDWEQFRPMHANVQSVGEINQSEMTMYDQLKAQLFMLTMDDELKAIIEFGIDSLNEDGYLDIELEEWASACGTTMDAVEEALMKIQSLEPTGIGARNLQECILLQLRQLNNYAPYIEDLVVDHLELVADTDTDSISRLYGVTIDEAKALIENIKLCNPKPGRLISTVQPEYIIPEASIHKEEGKWKISFYKWATPKITLNPQYEKLKDPANEATDYLKEKYKEIDSLKQAIMYRGSTLEQVIRIIMEKQLPFFEHGQSRIQPLTLREIAEELNLHISTVSRAISQKYVQTNHGVLPLKFFLQSGVRKGNGKVIATLAIKQLIQEMIKYEDRKKPLSDKAIKQKLRNEFAIEVARRTVMKYRDQLHIPSSMKRKQEE